MILRCLNRRPGDRFGSTSDVVAALAGEKGRPGGAAWRATATGYVDGGRRLSQRRGSRACSPRASIRSCSSRPTGAGPRLSGRLGRSRSRCAVAVLGFKEPVAAIGRGVAVDGAVRDVDLGAGRGREAGG